MSDDEARLAPVVKNNTTRGRGRQPARKIIDDDDDHEGQNLWNQQRRINVCYFLFYS